MSPRKRTGADADLAEAPYLDDAERAEAEWLVRRERDPGAAPPSQNIAREYAELEGLLRDLPSGPAGDHWHDAVLTRARSQSPARSSQPATPWWRRAVARWTAGGVLVAIAAAVILVVVLPRAPGELEVAIRHVDTMRGDASEAVVGDRLVVTARPAGSGDLRVYRADGRLVVRRPGGPGCRSAVAGTYTIDVALAAPVQHRVVLAIGLRVALPVGTLDAYLAAARADDARIVIAPPIDVH